MLVGLIQAVSLSTAWLGSMLVLESWEQIRIQNKHGSKKVKKVFTLTHCIPALGYHRRRHQASNERQGGEWKSLDRQQETLRELE